MVFGMFFGCMMVMDESTDRSIERFSAFLSAQPCTWFLPCNIYGLCSSRVERLEAALAINTQNFMNGLYVLLDWAKRFKTHGKKL